MRPTLEIGHDLGRASRAVAHKAHELLLPDRRWAEPWTSDDLAWLAQEAGARAAVDLAAALGRTTHSVERRLAAMRRKGGIPYKCRPWSQEELSLLRETYGKVSPAVVAQKLGRSPMAVKVMAQRIGVARDKGRQAWTEEEIRLLKERFGTKPTKVLARELGRSPDSVASKAWGLDLSTRRKSSGGGSSTPTA